MAKPTILHITPHMGGGVGNVISGIAAARGSFAEHRLVLLEPPVNKKYLEVTLEAGIKTIIQPDGKLLANMTGESDIVLIHWWHHPRTAKLLCHFPQIPVRIVLWTHVSGLTVPALSGQMLLESSMVWFTSPASYEAGAVKALPREAVERKISVVYGCAGIDHLARIEHKKPGGLNIGYLGYVDFTKLHPEFISFCKAVAVPEARFIMAGDAPARHMLEKQAREQEVKNEFVYLGYVSNIAGVLADFHVFGYPLMPSHTCTTENAILEAMAAGVPPVVLNQLSEKYIVKNGETGFLVNNKEEYGNVIRYLYYNPAISRIIGMKAREHVLGRYNRQKLLQTFYSGIENAMKLPKKRVCFKKIMGVTPAEWFVSGLGQDAFRFKKSLLAGIRGQTSDITDLIKNCSPILKAQNKSSIFHYAREFPEDAMLHAWANMIKEAGKDDG